MSGDAQSEVRLADPLGLDKITAAELRARRGGEKWTRHDDCIGAFVAEMDFGTAPEIEAALRGAIDRCAFGYLPDPLVEELRAACAGYYASRFGWAPPVEWIEPVADVLKAAELAITLFSAPDSAVILPTPAYMPFLVLPGLLGRELIQVPMLPGAGGWQFDYEAIDAAFEAGGGTLILCNPANPLGRVFTAAELEPLTEIVDRHDGRVFSDEIHAPLIYPGHRHLPYASLSARAAAHTVTGFSASKGWNVPGLKCAQLLISNPDDAARWRRSAGFANHGASTLGVIANTVAYREGQAWLQQILDYLDGNRRLLAELLAELAPEVGFEPPAGTYLAWLDLRRTGVSGDLALHFREQARVALFEGSDSGRGGKGFIRFNFALPRPILRDAVQRIAAALPG